MITNRGFIIPRFLTDHVYSKIGGWRCAWDAAEHLRPATHVPNALTCFSDFAVFIVQVFVIQIFIVGVVVIVFVTARDKNLRWIRSIHETFGGAI